MDDKTYKQIKEMLDSTIAECRQLTAMALESSQKCEKLSELCTRIAEDLAKRGDGI